MYGALARFDARFRWLIVAAWIVAVVAGTALLPSLGKVIQSGNVSFLPSSAPSVQAAGLAGPFQGNTGRAAQQNRSSTAIIVAYRASGLTSADQAAIARVDQAARRVPGVLLVRYVGTSADGKAAQSLVTVTGSVANNHTGLTNLVKDVRGTFSLGAAPAGLSLHLAGPVAANVDSSNTSDSKVLGFVLIFVIILLFVVFRSVLAPLLTIIPALLSLQLAEPLVAQAAKAGLHVSPDVDQLMIVLVVGVGVDYGLFLAFRFREELARGVGKGDALVAAMTRVGEAITYSALTVALALLALLLATFAVFRDLGPALAIGVGVMLAASLTLTPALLAIFGQAAFWPVRPKRADQAAGVWGRVAERVVQRPVAMLVVGVVVFCALAAGLAGYRTGGETPSAPAGTDSAAGQTILDAHFPKANLGGDQLLLRFADPLWTRPAVLDQVQAQLASDPVFASVTGPLGTGHGVLTGAGLAALHAKLGPADALPSSPPAGTAVPPQEYQAYRATAQFISSDGRTLQYYAVLKAGPVGSVAALAAIPQARDALTTVAAKAGAQANGFAGQDASGYDVNAAANSSIVVVIPAVLIVILLLLGLLLRSVVAPLYLAVTVGLSYLAALGFAMIVFVHLSGQQDVNLILPLLLFVFAMAVGEDYNILVMSRIREEATKSGSLREALSHAIGITGGTVTSAGIILAGTFTVLGFAGGNSDAQQIGFTLAFAVILDTFFVRTLLVPSIVMLLGRWNWWPSALSRTPATSPAPEIPSHALSS